MVNLNMKKKLLLGIVALSVALPAVPAFADKNDDARHRIERQHRHEEHWKHEREARQRREHRDHRFAFREPFFGPRCFTRDGYWTYDGWQRVWVPPERICR